jgi:hypothetical protein
MKLNRAQWMGRESSLADAFFDRLREIANRHNGPDVQVAVGIWAGEPDVLAWRPAGRPFTSAGDLASPSADLTARRFEDWLQRV